MIVSHSALAATAGITYSLLMAVICISALRRSSFGYLIIFYEYFYILGLGVFPLLASLALVEVAAPFREYESATGGLAFTTFAHVILYGVGSLLGYFGARDLARKFSSMVIAAGKYCKLSNLNWFYFSSVASIFFNVLYFCLVGVDVALLNAAPVRSGDFSGLDGFQQYSFIKTLAMIGLFSVVSMPFIIIRNIRLLSTFLITLLMAGLLYVQSVARVVFLDTVLMYALFYFMLKKGSHRSRSVIALVTFMFLLFILIYGKEFVGVLSAFLFQNGDFVLVQKYDDFPSYFFSQFGHLIYSVDAGVSSFFDRGPILPRDILLAPFGFFPSSFFSSLGLDVLSYQLVDESGKLSCINAAYFPLADKCSVPPYITGFSAYTLPMIGGLIFGFLRFFAYSVLEISWIELQKSPQFLWIIIAILLLINKLALFIPNTISLAIFSALVLFGFILYPKVKLRLFGGRLI
jgi:hypothetical protein